jgi:hypothetical protein
MTASRSVGPWLWATLAVLAGILCSGFLYFREHGPRVVSYAILEVVCFTVFVGLMFLAVQLFRFLRRP